MPQKPSILDMMRNDMEDNDTAPPQSPVRAPTPTIGFSYDYTMDEPPVIQRITDRPRHSTPHPDPPTLSARPRPVSQAPLEWEHVAKLDKQNWNRYQAGTGCMRRMATQPRSNYGHSTHKEPQRILPTLDQNQNLLQPPAAGLMTQHQDVFFIPPPRVVGGAKGTSAQ